MPGSYLAFPVRERDDAFRFYVPGGNPGARIARLPEPERTFAVERLRAWMGVSAPATRALAPEAELPEPFTPRFRP